MASEEPKRSFIAEHVLLLSAILAVLYWLVQTLVEATLFTRLHEHWTFRTRLFPWSDHYAFYLRALVVCLLVGSGEVARHIIRKLKRTEAELLDARRHLEVRVEQRTRQLRESNEQLQLEIAERRRAEEALREGEERYRQLFNDAPVGYHELDTNGLVTRVNRTELLLLGYPEEEMIGRAVWEFMQDSEASAAAFHAKLAGEKPIGPAFERVFKTKGGDALPVLVEDRLLRNQRDEIVGIRSTMQDITELKRAEEAIKHLAYYDTLTGLPNRALFADRLTIAIANAHRNRRRLGLIFLDLDGFKEVNDTLGHDMGDQLLRQVGANLKRLLRRSDTVARMGGDEFVILLPEIVEPDHAQSVAEKALAAFQPRVKLADHDFHVTASIGIAVYPDDAQDGTSLMKYADIAMYQSKKAGRNQLKRFLPEMKAAAGRHGSSESEEA